MAFKLLRLFLRKEHGAIAVMFALMLPVIVGFVGLGVDIGVWYMERRTIQTAADAAAVSAMYEKNAGESSSVVTAAATTDATKNGYDTGTDTLTVNNPPLSGPYIGDSGYVEVIINRQLTTFLSEIVLNTPPIATARAVAGITGADMEACVLALSSSAQNSVYMNGAGSTVDMDGCGVMANSTHGTKSVNVQNGTFNVDCIGAAGGINEGGTITTACGSTLENQSPIDDPYADLAIPAFSGCDYDGPGNNSYSSSNGDYYTTTGGIAVFCGGLKVNSGDTVSFENGGIYIIDEGDFQVNGGATITGENVTIILTASDGSGMGTIKINGGSNVELTANASPSDPDYNGVLFYQDRDGGSSSSLDAIFNGGSTAELTGAIYLPNNDISFTGGNATDGNGCLMLVAQTVSFNGDADIENECDMYGGNPMVYGGNPGLVE